MLGSTHTNILYLTAGCATVCISLAALRNRLMIYIAFDHISRYFQVAIIDTGMEDNGLLSAMQTRRKTSVASVRKAASLWHAARAQKHIAKHACIAT